MAPADQGSRHHHSVQIGLRLRERDAGLEPANAVQAQTGATILQRGIVPLADQAHRHRCRDRDVKLAGSTPTIV